MNHDRRPVTVSAGLINIPSVGNGGNIFRSLLYGNFRAQIAIFVFDEDESVPNGVGLVERIDFQMQHVGRQAFRSDLGDPLNGIGDLHFVIDVLLKFHVDRFAGRRNPYKNPASESAHLSVPRVTVTVSLAVPAVDNFLLKSRRTIHNLFLP